MEISLSSPSTIASIFAFLLFFYHLAWRKTLVRQKNGENKVVPRAKGAWPIIGHLHLLGGSQPPHKTLGFMADKYGPIFTMKLGVHQALIVSDLEMAKECFTTNDKVFASRPKSIAAELMGYNYAVFGLAPYGPYWRQIRKIVVLKLLSHRRLQILGHIRVSEVNSSIKHIFETWMKYKGPTNVVNMEMKQWFGDLTLNLIVRMLSGKRFSPDDEEGGRFQKLLRKLMELVGAFVVSDAIPCLRWLDLGGYEKVMKMTAKEMDDMLQGWVEDIRRKRNSGLQVEGKQQVFIDVMLSLLEDELTEDLTDFDADTIIKAACLAIVSAASDTSLVTQTWALSLLLNHPQVLKNAQQELDTHIGRERNVEESDMKNLVYLQAIIKETLRLYPAAPLLLPHESMGDCTVGGYNIPKGTYLLVNAYKIHRDPHIWCDPHEFRPERFLTSQKEIDFRGQHFEFIPFGSGRRICPGISFAFQSMQLTLASLIHGFDLRNPSEETIDMQEIFGITVLKATPLEVLLSPRLSPNLYV